MPAPRCCLVKPPHMDENDPEVSPFWDLDIAAMNLTYVEKNGLQIYRNYQNSFQLFKIGEFRKSMEVSDDNVQNLETILDLLASDDLRICVIALCAFAEEMLSEAIQSASEHLSAKERKQIFSPLGPLSSLSSKILLCKLFSVLSDQILDNVEKLRLTRNKIAHGYGGGLLEIEINEIVQGAVFDAKNIIEKFINEVGERHSARLLMMLVACRLMYEKLFWYKCKMAAIDSAEVLYNHPATDALSFIMGKFRSSIEKIK